VNFYLPDAIFDHSGAGEKLVRFTYEKRYNVLSMSMAFVRLVSASVLMSLLLLLDSDKASYHYKKPKK